jgi:hypothetical protein
VTDVGDLTDEQVVAALRLVGKAWIESRGLEAFAVMQDARTYADRHALALPEWTFDATADGVPGELCRRALEYVVAGSDAQARNWAHAAIEQVSKAKAYMLDPATLAVGGLVLIGIILAVRVKRVGAGGAEFYKGLPEETARLLKAATTFFRAGG